jgi:hypothetical protein
MNMRKRTAEHSLSRWAIWGIGLLALSPSPATAQTCIDDLTGTTNTCTANDVRITNFSIVSVIDGCVSASDTATVNAQITLLAGTNRFDIGVFIAQDGGFARTGSCLHEYLPPPLAVPPGHDPGSGSGPYAQNEGGSGDACGDIIANEQTLRDLNGLVVQCADFDSNGTLDVGTCISWDNQTSNNCNSVGEAIPGTKSKCNCEPVEVPNTGVPNLGLTKSCVPDTARPGETISCTISYQNTGLGPADFMSFVDDYDETAGTVSNIVVPGGDAAVDDGSTITWSPGGAPAAQANIPAGASGTMTYDFTLSGSLGNGDSFSNTVTAHWQGIAQPSLSATETTNVVTTAAIVTSFEVYADSAGRTVVWETASESRTAGFFVERLSRETGRYVRIHRQAVAALLQPQGGTYRFHDDSPDDDRLASYQLVELEFDGLEKVLGQYRVPVRAASDRVTPASAKFESRPRGTSRRMSGRLRNRSTDLLRYRDERPPQRAGGDARRLKISVRGEGIYALELDAIAKAWGLSAETIRQDVRRSRLLLTRRGEPVSWIPSDDGGAILFYAPPFESIYTLDDVFWLERGFGRRGSRHEAGNSPGAAPLASFHESLRIEQDGFAVVAMPLDAEGDFWFWSFLSGLPGDERSFSFAVPHPAPSEDTARLTIDFQGFQEKVVHRFSIFLNRALVGQTSWSGLDRHSASFELDPALLNHGGNNLSVRAESPSGPQSIGAFLDGFTLEYERFYRALGNRLSFTASDETAITVYDFESPDVAVWDVEDPAHPRPVAAAIEEHAPGRWRTTFAPASGSRYLAVTESAYSPPYRIELREKTTLLAASASADYIIVVPEEMASIAESFAAYRETTGFAPLSATVEAIMDEVGEGIRSPRAIRDFLGAAYDRSGGRLRHALLAGGASYDFRDLLGIGGNLVPSMLSASASGLLVTDHLLGDVRGNDGIPEIAIGRVTALTGRELEDYFAKVKAFEAEPPSDWQGRLLMLADNPDLAGDFWADADELTSSLPASTEVERIYLGDTRYPLAEARPALLGAWNDGLAAVSYLGHGSLINLAGENLLDIAAVETLSNGSRLPLFVGLTCHIGRFDIPGFEPLSSVVLLNAAGGAIAVLAPGGASVNRRAKEIGSRFLPHGIGTGRTLGEALLLTFRDVSSAPSTLDLLKTYHLLGDPAVRLHVH